MDDTARLWLWLASADGIFAKWFYMLQNFYTDIETVWERAEYICDDIKGFPQKLQSEILKNRNQEYLDTLTGNINKEGLSFSTLISEDYPHPLRQISDPPPVLYYKGILPKIWERSIAVVGTRRPTRSGISIAGDISRDLALAGVTVISGMARGLDTAAHKGCLDAGGATVAVLGCGAETVYPPENTELYRNIIDGGGAVLSEFRPGTPPVAENFPRRNRVMAALASAAVVGEGGEKSGAMITVEFSVSFGKQVFVLPCDLKSPVSALPLFLLESGAQLVRNAADVMSAMEWKYSFKNPVTKDRREFLLDLLQQDIYNLLSEGDYTSEQISGMLGIPLSKVNSNLTLMEISGAVVSLPGNIFSVK